MHNSFTFMIDIPVFRSLLPAEMELLKKNGTIKKYPPRSIIQTEGQSATFFAVMTKGLAKAVLFCEDGREILLHFYKPGDFFGEMNLSDIRECPFSIISAKPCEFLLMDIDVMVQLIRKNGNFAYSLFSFVSKRLNRTQKRLRDTIYERKYSVNPVRFFRIFTSLTKGMLFFSKEKSSLCL